MAKSNFFKSKTKKSVIALLAATAVTCTGLAAACSKTDDENKSTALRTKQEDSQLLKNGNFEFFDYPSDEYLADGKAAYLIKTPDNWSRSGDSSNAMSGIIGTSSKAWASLTSPELKGNLEYNADLATSDEEYVDYNGMKARDLLYKDTYAALRSAEDVNTDGKTYIDIQGYKKYFDIQENDDGKFYFGAVKKADGSYDFTNAREVAQRDEKDEDGNPADIEYYFVNEDGSLSSESVRLALIDNPGTHLTEDELAKLYKGDGEDEYYYDEDKKYSATNVLMVHNYPTNDYYNGISQYYSSQTLTLEAHTAAEISLWVKTSNLKFDKGHSQLDEQDRGAFIEVVQTVSGSSIDSFKIKAINTEKIIKDNPELNTNNGWLQYTVYINACDFADSTVQIRLGLGQSDNSEKCTGYAFFDDVSVAKFRDFDEKDDDNNFKSTFNKAVKDGKLENTTCALTSEEDKKIFYADRELRSVDNARHSKDFHYYIDLASESGLENSNGYAPLAFGNNVTAALTTEKDKEKLYASAKKLEAKVSGGINKVTDNNGKDYDLHKSLKAEIDTKGDLIGAFGVGGVTASDFNATDYSAKLNDALTGENGFNKLPGYVENTSNMLVILSARGAAYTSTINADGVFELAKNEYMLVSFWVKTSEISNGSPATIKITDVKDEKNSANLAVDTTGIKTNFEGEEDIYNGWVQCFIFVANESDDDTPKTFKLDFMFGNTTLAGNSESSYDYGWIAMANMQTLKINEDIYDLASAGTYALKFSFGEEDESKKDVPFTDASLISDIKNGIATPSNYTGVNGGDFDGKNSNGFAGLINRDEFENYDADLKEEILTSFVTSATNWNDVFGEECYQPLIIVTNLRTYAENAKATKDTYKKYYVEDKDGEYSDIYGKHYRKVGDDEEFDEKTTYYSLKDIVNYGYISENKSVSSNSYETVSIKVKAGAGANAYVYLVDPDTREVLKFSTPEKTFYYDTEGNVLNKEYSEDMTDDEHRAAIVYKLRKDGLYDSTDSTDKNVYANTSSLIKSYKYYKYEGNTFYNANGDYVSFDDLRDGETYYSDKNGTVANHYLCTSNGKRVYEYKNGTYYYLGAEKEIAVKEFDTARATLRYENADSDLLYMVNVNGGANGSDWVTVNFVIHTGSKSLDYRIEIWNGERGSTGVDADGNYTTGAVAFDYSSYSVSSSNYSDLLGEYEGNIINKYRDLLKANNLLDKIESDEENVAYYEALVEEYVTDGDKEVEKIKSQYGYDAQYYTYTLYDSDTFEPYNEDTALEDETGYDYSITDFDETLAFFKYKSEDGEEISYNVFVDYSAIDQDIQKATVEDPEDSDDNDEDPTDWWLYISSILLVVALLITLVGLLLREFLKKNRRKNGDKAMQKNNYRQRKRYIRKLHLTENEVEPEDSEEAEPEQEEAEPEQEEATVEEETPAEETTEEATEEVTEAPAEEETSEEATDGENQTPDEN